MDLNGHRLAAATNGGGLGDYL